MACALLGRTVDISGASNENSPVDVPAKSESVMETSPGLVQNRARMTNMLA